MKSIKIITGVRELVWINRITPFRLSVSVTFRLSCSIYTAFVRACARLQVE